MWKTLICFLIFVATAAAADIRLGIIGTDTSHAIEFTRAFNDASSPSHIAGARVVVAYKGGSPDLPVSYQRVDKFAAELQTKYGIEFVPDIPTLCQKVDAILLESVDGRVHLKQVKEAVASRKPMFIDKPLAATLEDAREIARILEEAGVPWFSSSSSRFGGIATAMKFSDTTGVITWGPSPPEPLFPLDLAWYGIHSIELLYTLMGPGCEEVRRIPARDMEVIVGRWKDGRTGTVYALTESRATGAVIFRPKIAVQSDPKMEGGYGPLLREIVKFFQTRVPPVSPAETLEIFSFMDAAQRSKAAGGQPVRLR
jgi:hypothetical protein